MSRFFAEYCTYFLFFREKEASKDTEDRKKELDEIDELKSAIYSDPKLSDPAQEFQRRLQERERQFLPGAKQEARSRSRSIQSQPKQVRINFLIEMLIFLFC